MDRRLRLGVIGAGSWAVAAHLPALAQRDEVEFVGVCRKGDEMLERITARYGFEVASEHYDEVLDAKCDIVVVASPSATHYEHATAALESGAHVLCEKPMTIDPAQAWDLVDTARRVDRALLISFGWNYMPIVRGAKRLVEEHGIGKLEHLSLHMSSTTRELLAAAGAYPEASPESAPEPATWTDPSISGGGYGQAQLSHALGLALHLVPERIAAASAFMSAPNNEPVELHDAISVRFDGGGIGVVSGGSSHAGAWGDKHQLEVRAIGNEGQLIVDVHRELVWLFRVGEGERTIDCEPGSGAYEMGGPANALVDVALGRATNDCAPGDLGARTVEALDAAYRSARSGAVEPRR